MAMSDEVELLKDISRKLSQLIVITKISNSEAIAATKKKIREDPVSCALLNLADGTLSAGQLTDKVKKKTKKSERTVQGRIADLIENGALIAEKKETRFTTTILDCTIRIME